MKRMQPTIALLLAGLLVSWPVSARASQDTDSEDTDSEDTASEDTASKDTDSTGDAAPLAAFVGPAAPELPSSEALAPATPTPLAAPLPSRGRATAQVAGGSFLVLLGVASVILAGFGLGLAALLENHGSSTCDPYDGEWEEPPCEEQDDPTNGLIVLSVFAIIGGELSIATGMGRVVRGTTNLDRLNAATATP